MFCPSCGYTLQKLSVTTNSGGRFDVEHCGRCGGTWFDPYEINRIPYHEVVRIAKLTVLPAQKPAELKAHKCPRCHIELVSSKFESTPAGVRMLRCGKCGGIWATQKALEAFKKHQEETIKEYKMGETAFPSLSVVFVPALFVLMLFAVTFTTIASLDQSRENRIQAENSINNLIVTPITSTSVSIIFQTKIAVKSQISYGTDILEMKTEEVSVKPALAHSVVILGLVPNTRYIYKITLADETGRTYTTGENYFQTTDR